MRNEEDTEGVSRPIITFIGWLVIYQLAFTVLMHVAVALDSGIASALVSPIIFMASLVSIQFWYPLAILVALPVFILQLFHRQGTLWALSIGLLSVVAAWRIGIALVDLSMPVIGAVLSSTVLFALSAIHIWRALGWSYRELVSPR